MRQSINSSLLCSLLACHLNIHILKLSVTMSSNTALLLIDPYNDFLHTQGKLYGILAESIKDTDTITHLQEAVQTARRNRIPIFYCMHQQINGDSYYGWQNLNKSQTGLKAKKVFEEGSFGAKFFQGLEPDALNGDVVVSKHWNSRYVLMLLELLDVVELIIG